MDHEINKSLLEYSRGLFNRLCVRYAVQQILDNGEYIGEKARGEFILDEAYGLVYDKVKVYIYESSKSRRYYKVIWGF